MPDAFICDYIRTPIGRFGGALASVRADDLGAIPEFPSPSPCDFTGATGVDVAEPRLPSQQVDVGEQSSLILHHDAVVTGDVNHAMVSCDDQRSS